ncbi:MAG: hypothetical protein AM325_000700 [Candidatus Thorarchaeota archaeon SMTZ1-45]
MKVSTSVEELTEDAFGEYLALWLSAYDSITILFCSSESVSKERTAMKIIERLLDVFGKRRALLLGAATQPNDLMAYIYAARAHAYYRITGKKLPVQQLPIGESAEDITKKLSPSRRLARRGL